ncbi:uncharacterized protein MONOS_13074 [Monocercomonoides exilis]|uniref:uncharacterized protein n=1 Tax=Monocercomonoides exilis TaxID=2049356 RepID=UPI00355A07E2|nr:hypothetical protein MONOS_13074 [Monocercomonoides exilis]|eukprot:MONOS_13074.1-p1 / transcript=MONOS_13074.1 / gene=MONOS_13074 / organism=Monocercomonoides_exilis_PA203 / gene_product=unspecified product / transcript_product=unspecified product / location=Mono_scaffold00775:3503-4045(-) / protein_length=181 / sequence_SO=supercontig / SO=protein_coding / is_pseudo=false
MRNGSWMEKELQGTLRSSARFMAQPRNEERSASSNGRCKESGFQLQIERRAWKGNQWEKPKANMKKKEKDEFSTSEIDAFDARLAHAVTEKRRRDREREGGCKENEDEKQQSFFSFDSALSSAQLFTQNIATSSTINTPLFSPLPHTQLSAPSVLVGTPPKPLTPSPQSTDFSSLTLKSI